MDITETHLPGCYLVQPKVFPDSRGQFVKLYSGDVFEKAGITTDFPELACSISRKGVLRGLHFQLPPADHAKMVYCADGKVIDAVVDLRVGSPTYGQGGMWELDSAKGTGLYIPRGFAHGFYVPVDKAVFVYKIETPWVPALDAGIAWDSAGLDWPDKNPVLSDKDRKLPRLAEFKSPFVYRAK